MPMMMEDAIDVDDLFVDPTLELGLANVASTVKGLAQRLDELRLLGCCQKVTWSKLGVIAYISQDGHKVLLRYLHCRPDDGQWALSDESVLDAVAETHGGRTLVHLCWNESGSDLAVVDSTGRISTFSSPIALNVFTISRPASEDAEDDGGGPVGLVWLNLNRPMHAFHKGTKANGRWAYVPYRRRPLGPLHPLNKSGLVSVTRSGHIRLLYQNPDSKWAQISIEIRSLGFSDDILTHAALWPTDGGFLMATHSSCARICLYRVQVKWDPAQWEPHKPGAPPNPFPTPSFHLYHMKTETPSGIFQPAGHAVDNLDDFLHSNTTPYSLTHLEIIAPSPDTPGGSPKPYILAIFSLPVNPSAGQSHNSSPPSVIVRWQLDIMKQTLHPSFDDVVSKKANVQLKPKSVLRRQDDINLDRSVVAIEHIDAGNILAISYEDGSIASFDADSMTSLNGVEDVNNVTSMAQAGFSFPLDTPGHYISFSPNSCLAAVLDGDGQLRLRYMGHSFGAEDGLYDDGKFSSAMAALALAYARACCNESASDDVLALVMQQLTPDIQKSFINEVYRALPVNVDFTVEQDKLMNNQYIQKCLSMQSALGFKSRIQQRSLAAVVPWVTLNLRQISILFAYFFHFNKSGREAEAQEPEILRMIHGNVKWALDLAKYLVDDLFEMADNLQNLPTDPNSFSQSARNFESLSVMLILSSVPRSFLKYICRGIRGLVFGFKGAANLSAESFRIYSSIYNLIEESPLKVDVYEKLLANVDSAVKHAYQGAGFGGGDRAAPERELIITSNIPPVLQSAVVTILTKTMPLFRSEVDRMALCLQDYTWLGLGDDKRTELFKRHNEVDILKRVVIGLDFPDRATQPKRRCVRCCEVSEDVALPKTISVLRMVAKVQVLRSCICGGMWAVENVDKLPSQVFPG